MKYLVLGAGVSGLGAARLASKLGHNVLLSNDKVLADKDQQSLKSIGINVHIGAQTPELLNHIDVLIVSPGIAETHPVIVVASKNNISVLSEVDFALTQFTGTLVAVTGTNGKSTTTAMIAHILNALHLNAVACGNIGKAPSQILFDGESYDYWVMELSSYQSQGSNKIHADAVVFTSFSSDHLARHGTIEAYFAAKAKLCLRAKSDAPIILSTEAHQAFSDFSLKLPNKKLQVIHDEPGFDFSCTSIHTKHDRLNALMAASCVSYLHSGYQLQQLLNLLSNFSSLPFRYNLVGRTSNGEAIINDSKATNVDSCLRALENQQKPCILLLGGQGKGESYLPITSHADVIFEAWCFGASGEEIAGELKANKVPSRTFPDLKACLQYFAKNFNTVSQPVIFSPACASFDEFKNFEDRGNFFNSEIKKYAKPV